MIKQNNRFSNPDILVRQLACLSVQNFLPSEASTLKPLPLISRNPAQYFPQRSKYRVHPFLIRPEEISVIR